MYILPFSSRAAAVSFRLSLAKTQFAQFVAFLSLSSLNVKVNNQGPFIQGLNFNLLLFVFTTDTDFCKWSPLFYTWLTFGLSCWGQNCRIYLSKWHNVSKHLKRYLAPAWITSRFWVRRSFLAACESRHDFGSELWVGAERRRGKARRENFSTTELVTAWRFILGPPARA